MHLRIAVPLLALAWLLLGCQNVSGPAGSADPSGPSGTSGASTGDAGSPRTDKAAADALAKHVLPALVDDLGVQVRAGAAAFVKCDYNGWRYQADGDLVGGAPSSTDDSASRAVRGVLAEQPGLEVEVRGDGSVVGRDGDLSILVGAPLGPPTRTFRHYTITHACTPYPSSEDDYLSSTASTDYGAYVPPAARYAG